MEEDVEEDIEFSETLFFKTFNMLKKKGARKYDFILNAGPSLLSALYKLYETVWKTEEKPDSWRDSVLIQLYKGKGLKEDLNN